MGLSSVEYGPADTVKPPEEDGSEEEDALSVDEGESVEGDDSLPSDEGLSDVGEPGEEDDEPSVEGGDSEEEDDELPVGEELVDEDAFSLPSEDDPVEPDEPSLEEIDVVDDVGVLPEESDGRTSWLSGSIGRGRRRGTTPSASTATRINTPAPIIRLGSFDFFAAWPRPSDEERSAVRRATNRAVSPVSCCPTCSAAALAALSETEPAPAFFHVHSVLSPITEGASTSRMTVPTSSSTACMTGSTLSAKGLSFVSDPVDGGSPSGEASGGIAFA